MADTDFNGIASGLAGLFGNLLGARTANNVNSGVQSNLAQNNAATQAQIDSLTNQINLSRQQAQDMYQRSLGDVTAQNAGLQGNIDTLTNSLNALSDPNSAYMQNARQAIERKDAAAGRRSQWGDREVQLAGTLADYVGKYSPGLSGQITQARNQINANNQGLASLYANANSVADRNTIAQIQALQQQLQNTSAMNTTGRGAANSATNNLTGAINSGAGLLSSLFRGVGQSSLGGGSGLGTDTGYIGGWNYNDLGLGNGLGFTGGAIDNDYLGLAGTGSLDQGMSGYNPYDFTSSIGSYYDSPNSLDDVGIW